MAEEAEVIRVMRQFREDLLAQEAEGMAAMARRWGQVEDGLEAQIELLVREMAERQAQGLAVSQGALFELGRYRTLLAQVGSEWAKYQEYAAATIEAGQLVFGEVGLMEALAAMNAISPGIGATFAHLNIGAVQNLVGLLGNGSPLMSVLMNSAVKAEVLDGLTATLLRGTAMGWNPRKTARLMMDDLAGGLDQALRVSRTEQLRAYREMQRAQYQASGVVDGYYRLATRDKRTCAACLRLDGEFYDLSVPLNEHVQGRCAQVPAVQGFAPPQWQKGKDWFMTLPANDQKDILGQGRFEAWKEGLFDFDDVATVKGDGTWGAQAVVAPLNALIG